MKKLFSLPIAALVLALAACGGGGGTSPPVETVSALTFPLASVFLNSRKTSSSSTFTISGNCSGTGSENVGAPYGTSLYGATYGQTSVTTLNYANCSGSGITSSNSYLDQNYYTIASVAADQKYAEYTVVNRVPDTVKVGDTITLSNFRSYNNYTKSSLVATGVRNLVVESDTASTVIVVLSTLIYGTTNQLLMTTQDRYRLSSNGTFKEIYYKIDLPSGQTETWTYN